MAALGLMAAVDMAGLGVKNADGTVFNNFVSGKASITKSGPLAIAYAEEAKFDDTRSGNGHVRLQIIVKYPMAVDTDGVDPMAQSDLLTSAVFDAFRLGKPGDGEATATAMNGIASPVADFTAMQTTVLSEEANAEEGQVWVETLTLDVYAAQVSGF